MQALACRRLVFDIETAPATDLRKAPPTIAQAVAKTAERMECDEGKVMALSPFFGHVVSLAIGDADHEPETMPVTVLVVPPPKASRRDLPEWVRPVSERELLETFWGWPPSPSRW